MVLWASLLNFFSDNRSKLSLPEKISIYKKCEDFRIFWSHLHIDKNEIFPNHIYTDNEILDYYQTISQTRKTQLSEHNNNLATDSDRDTNLLGKAPALAV